MGRWRGLAERRVRDKLEVGLYMTLLETVGVDNDGGGRLMQ